jgi:DNA-binding response OmpR family regulator
MECNILLIDDNEDDQILFKRILTKSGIESQVVCFTDATEGLEMVKHSTFDCIFLDYNLPEMDGMEFLKRVREQQLETPVIMLTGQSDAKVIIDVMKEGAIDYISKNSLNEDVLRLSILNAKNLSEARFHKRQAENALKISEARLAEAQTIARVGNWEYNFKTNTFFLSGEARRILEYLPPENERPDFRFLRYIEGDDLFKVMQAVRNKNNHSKHDVTFRLRAGDKSLKFIHAQGYVIKNDEKGIHIAKGTIQDVTILKIALRDIQKARIGRKATTIVFGIAIVVFLISEALLDPFVDGLSTSLLIGLSFKGGVALFLKPIETFLEKFMMSRILIANS